MNFSKELKAIILKHPVIVDVQEMPIEEMSQERIEQCKKRLYTAGIETSCLRQKIYVDFNLFNNSDPSIQYWLLRWHYHKMLIGQKELNNKESDKLADYLATKEYFLKQLNASVLYKYLIGQFCIAVMADRIEQLLKKFPEEFATI